MVLIASATQDIDLKHNTGHILWDASYVLARYLELHVGKVFFAGKLCLELGAGTGLPGVQLVERGLQGIVRQWG